MLIDMNKPYPDGVNLPNSQDPMSRSIPTFLPLMHRNLYELIDGRVQLVMECLTIVQFVLIISQMTV